MVQKEIEKLFQTIRNVCPQEFDVEIKQTQKPNLHLVIIKNPSQTVDIHTRIISSIYPLHWKQIVPLLEKPGDIRILYCYGNEFALYSPFNGIFKNFSGMLKYDAYGYENHHHYIGKCNSIDEIVSFLTETPRLVF